MSVAWVMAKEFATGETKPHRASRVRREAAFLAAWRRNIYSSRSDPFVCFAQEVNAIRFLGKISNQIRRFSESLVRQREDCDRF